jgi:hypothetical protein
MVVLLPDQADENVSSERVITAMPLHRSTTVLVEIALDEGENSLANLAQSIIVLRVDA